VAIDGIPNVCGMEFGVKRLEKDGASVQGLAKRQGDGLPVKWGWVGGWHRISLSAYCRLREGFQISAAG